MTVENVVSENAVSQDAVSENVMSGDDMSGDMALQGSITEHTGEVVFVSWEDAGLEYHE